MPLAVSQPWMPRRPPVSSPSTPVVAPSLKLTGKDGSADNTDGHTARDIRPYTPPTAYDSSSHSVSLHSHRSATLPCRHRTSILSVASDAFGFRKKIGSFSRKKPNLSHPSNIVPDVIEISSRNNTTVTSTTGGSTTHRDYEHEERGRLRDVAAQSIGLGPELLHNAPKPESRSSPNSQQSSLQPARIPPFPATLSALRPFTELSSPLTKFTPPSSLLVYALSKQWKLRTIVLTSHPPGHKTHVHLFKNPSRDERELERLEVTENSVIFVAEEEVGGRRNVVKLAGEDAFAKRNVPSGEQSLHMWFLHISDPADSQRWIAAIKNAVLNQRAVRAGLSIPAQAIGQNEPKGDIDVLLSMHLQGLISTLPSKPSLPLPPEPASPSPPPSLRSMKTSVPSSSSPPTAMKGIFSGTRPRSPSVEGSRSSTYSPGHAEDSFGIAGTSLLTMRRTKPSTDPNSSPAHSLPLPLPPMSGQGSPAPSLRSANAPVIFTALDLKISRDRDAPESSTAVSDASSSGTSPSPISSPTSSFPQSPVTLSLQPPPRKCKHVVATSPATLLPSQQGIYKQAGGNRSVAGNFGILSGSSGDVTARETSPVSPGLPNFSGDQRGSFSPNLSSILQPPYIGEVRGGEQGNEEITTSLGNGAVNFSSSPWDQFLPRDKLSQSTAITKKWSRQGVPLPKQLTPPSGPPPSIPSSSGNDQRTSMESGVSVPVTCVTDCSPAGSSNSQSQALTSSRSGASSPTFRKRASNSSTYSVGSTSTSDSRGQSRIPVSLGVESLYPPSKPIVSKGTPSRPVSLLAPISSPVGYIGAVKRRSMPPPRPAPNFAPPPTPAVEESTTESTMSVPERRKSFRNSVAQRAVRLSLTSPKPPPLSVLPPRPDEAVFSQNHRRSSSSGTLSDQPISASSLPPSSALSAQSNSIEPVPPRAKSVSLRQRLRILSIPSTSTSPVQSPSYLPSVRVSTLDLSDDNDDDNDLPTPSFRSSSSFGLGEHIMMMQHESSFLQLSTPVTPNGSKLVFCSSFRPMSPTSSTMSGPITPPLESDRDFVALSPPPRRASKPYVVAVKQPGVSKADGSVTAQRQGTELVKLSRSGSVVSLGFVTP